MNTLKKSSSHEKRGRPSGFGSRLTGEICRRLAAGEPLARICRDAHMPTKRTVSNWVRTHPDFAKDFRVAREDGFDAIAHRCREVARGRGESTLDVQRDRLIIDTDLKLLSKWDPKRYGKKLDLELGACPVVRVIIGRDA